MKRIFTAFLITAAALLAAVSCNDKVSCQKAGLTETVSHGKGETHCLELEISVQLPTGKKVSEEARKAAMDFIWSMSCLEGAPRYDMTAEQFVTKIAESCREEYLAGDVYQDDDNFENRIFFTCGEVWKDILCYGYGTYVYIGGAHGGWIESYCNIGLETGHVYTLEDFVPKESFDALDNLLTEHLGDLDEQVRESLWEESVRHSEAFSVGKAGLTFHYGEYELGPYYLGTIDLTVPWNELENI